MEKKVAIVQSNYIPWKGYFDLINRADEFILFDDVQYTRRDWRNRNLIKTPNGLLWLTVPVEVKGKYLQKIKDTLISDPDWGGKHWKTIVQNYSRAPYFKEYRNLFEELYCGTRERLLSTLNGTFIKAVCDLLGIAAKISWSMDYEVIDGKSERLLHLCKQAAATEYISGPAAKSYLDEELFRREGISVVFMDYSGYPEYNQLFPPFEHGVSIIDLIFNEGPHARQFMKSF
nr:WbqC family protein [Deltaproteobacteria bacterium]